MCVYVCVRMHVYIHQIHKTVDYISVTKSSACNTELFNPLKPSQTLKTTVLLENQKRTSQSAHVIGRS